MFKLILMETIVRKKIEVPVIINREAYVVSKVSKGIPGRVADILADVTECKRDVALKNALVAHAYNETYDNLLFAILLECNSEGQIYGVCESVDLDPGPILSHMASIDQSHLLNPNTYGLTSDEFFSEQIVDDGITFVNEGLRIRRKTNPVNLKTYHPEIDVLPIETVHFKMFSREDIENYLEDSDSVEDNGLLSLLEDGYAYHIDFMFKRMIYQLNGLIDVPIRRNVIDDLYDTVVKDGYMSQLMYTHYNSFLITLEHWDKIHE